MTEQMSRHDILRLHVVKVQIMYMSYRLHIVYVTAYYKINVTN